MKTSIIVIMFFIFILFMIIFLITSFILIKEQNKYKNWIKIKGTCIDYIRKKSNLENNNSPYLNYPIVIYKIDNKEYKITSYVGYKEKNFINKKFTVLYNPNKPNEAILTNEVNFKLRFLICILFGIISIGYYLINLLI